MTTRAVRAFLCAVPLASFLNVACSSAGPSEAVAARDDVGTVGLTLQTSSGTTLTSVSYVITGPGGFTKSGSIDVSNSTKITGLIGGVPAGSGYSIELSATSTDVGTSCAGSASFDVIAGQTATVAVGMTCHEGPRSGSVLVNGMLNSCPVIDEVGANPDEVMVGSSVSLTAVAHDSDAGPAPLSYAWSAPSGSFSDPSSANPTFTCASIGSVTATLTVSDGDPSATCAATAAVTISCSPNQVVTHPYPGITLIQRTDNIPLPAPARQVKMNVVFADLNEPAVHFKLTPQGQNLPPDNFGTAGWPTPYPSFEVVRQTTLDFLTGVHGQVAINGLFFAPFPVPTGSDQGAYAYVIGLAASQGNVYSAFETPFQNYAITANAPAINIDRQNNATVVHRDPNFADGEHVLENVTLWNTLAGSAQIITGGVKSIPQYNDASHPDGLLVGNSTYSNSHSWYDLINSRTAIGLTQDKRTVVLFTVDVRPSSGANRSQGMSVGEVADVLLGYGVWDALNLDGGGSTSMALQDPADNVTKVINVSSDPAPGRAEATNLAVYSDDIPPLTTAVVSPPPDASGSNSGAVSVALSATDLRNGMSGDLPGWVDQIQFSLSGAQSADLQVVSGNAANVNVTAPGVTTLTYFATDAAGNAETPRTLTIRSGSAN
jgi:hypothetical protein